MFGAGLQHFIISHLSLFAHTVCVNCSVSVPQEKSHNCDCLYSQCIAGHALAVVHHPCDPEGERRRCTGHPPASSHFRVPQGMGIWLRYSPAMLCHAVPCCAVLCLAELNFCPDTANACTSTCADTSTYADRLWNMSQASAHPHSFYCNCVSTASQLHISCALPVYNCALPVYNCALHAYNCVSAAYQLDCMHTNADAWCLCRHCSYGCSTSHCWQGSTCQPLPPCTGSSAPQTMLSPLLPAAACP